MAGKPAYYKTAKDLQAAIDQYFKDGVKLKKVYVGRADDRRVEEIPVPTITGLCFYLGFASRQSFYDMEKERPKLAYTVKRARLFIEKEYEEQLQAGNTVGAIFALKNFGWTDNQNLNIGGQPENRTPIPVIMFGTPEIKNDNP